MDYNFSGLLLFHIFHCRVPLPHALSAFRIPVECATNFWRKVRCVWPYVPRRTEERRWIGGRGCTALLGISRSTTACHGEQIIPRTEYVYILTLWLPVRSLLSVSIAYEIRDLPVTQNGVSLVANEGHEHIFVMGTNRK